MSQRHKRDWKDVEGARLWPWEQWEWTGSTQESLGVIQGWYWKHWCEKRGETEMALQGATLNPPGVNWESSRNTGCNRGQGGEPGSFFFQPSVETTMFLSRLWDPDNTMGVAVEGKDAVHRWVWCGLCMASGWSSPALVFTSRAFFHQSSCWKLVMELQKWKTWQHVCLRKKVQRHSVLCTVLGLLEEGVRKECLLFRHVLLGDLWTWLSWTLQHWECKKELISTFYDEVFALVFKQQVHFQQSQIDNELLLDFCNLAHCVHKPGALWLLSSPYVIQTGLKPSNGIQLCHFFPCVLWMVSPQL